MRRSPRALEQVLAEAEARARRRIAGHLRGVHAELETLVGEHIPVQRHPRLSAAAAAAAGAAVAPLLLRALRPAGGALRHTASLAGLIAAALRLKPLAPRAWDAWVGAFDPE